MSYMIGITLVAGPSLIAVAVILVLLVIYQLATQKGDRERSEAARSSR